MLVYAFLWLGSIEKVKALNNIPSISVRGDRVDALLQNLATHVRQNENSKVKKTLTLITGALWQELAHDSVSISRWNINQKALVDLDSNLRLEGRGDLYLNVMKIALSTVRPTNKKRVTDQANKVNKALEKANQDKGYGFLIRLVGDRLEKHNRPFLAEKFYLSAIDAHDQVGEHLEMAHAFNDLGILKYRQSEFDEAKAYFNRAITLAKEIPYHPLLIRLNSNIGILYANEGDFLEAIAYYEKSHQLAVSTKDKRAESASLINLGATFARQGMFPEALDHFFQSLEIKVALNDSIGMAKLYNNIGSLYHKIEQYEEALGNLKRALIIKRRLGRDHELQSTLKNIGDLYMEMDSLSKAKEVFDESYHISQKLNIPLKLASAHIGLGRLHLRMKDLVEAERWFRLSLDIYKETGVRIGEVEALRLLGEAVLLQKRYDQAASILENALETSNEIGTDRETMLAHQLVAKAYQGSKEFRKAYEHQVLFKVFSDSLFNKENSLEVARQETRSELQAKDYKINLLNERRAAETKQKVYFMWISGLVFMLALFIFFYFRSKLLYTRRTIQLKQELEQMKSRFFADVNHELRAPISMMTMTIDRLREKSETSADPALMEQLNKVYQNCQKLEGLVGEILDADKIENQGLSWDAQPVNLFGLLEVVRQNFEAMILEKKIEFIFTFMPDKEIMISCDRPKFEKIISNLISNALKFTPDNGKVRMIVNQNLENDQLEIKIQDTGKGIPEQDISLIFDRYYSSADKKRKKPGLGIGLSMVKEYADLMGTEIIVQSKPNKGTVFTLIVPDKVILLDHKSRPRDLDDEAVHLEQKENSSIPSSEEQPLILVVDDDPEMIDLICTILTSSYVLCNAASGRDAWQMISTQQIKPALIVTDLIMPEMTGYELIEKIKNHNNLNHIPIIVLTGVAGEDQKVQTLRMGVDDYLIKPFSSEELLARVDNQVKRHLDIINAHAINEEDIEFENEHSGPSVAELEWLKQAEQILIAHVEDSKYDITQLADELALSKSQVARKIKRLTGLSPNKYFREIRLNSAKQLLESGEYGTVSQIAYKVGFDTPAYFSDLFYIRFGKKPIEYVRSGYAYE